MVKTFKSVYNSKNRSWNNMPKVRIAQTVKRDLLKVIKSWESVNYIMIPSDYEVRNKIKLKIAIPKAWPIDASGGWGGCKHAPRDFFAAIQKVS